MAPPVLGNAQDGGGRGCPDPSAYPIDTARIQGNSGRSRLVRGKGDELTVGRGIADPRGVFWDRHILRSLARYAAVELPATLVVEPRPGRRTRREDYLPER